MEDLGRIKDKDEFDSLFRLYIFVKKVVVIASHTRFARVSLGVVDLQTLSSGVAHVSHWILKHRIHLAELSVASAKRP